MDDLEDDILWEDDVVLADEEDLELEIDWTWRQSPNGAGAATGQAAKKARGTQCIRLRSLQARRRFTNHLDREKKP